MTYMSGGLSFSAVSGIVASGDIMSHARGMKTREKVLALKPEYSDSEVATGTGTYIYRAFYYDKLERLVQTAERNILGQTCRVSTKYDFTGNPVLIRETQQTVFGSGNEVSADTSLTYDREGRITGMSVTLSPVTATASYGYDSIGRPVTRTLGSTSSPAAVITDSYTIQGWLSQRSSIPFTSQIRYDNPAHGATPGTPGLAGNITEWKTFRNGSTANGSTYAFTYDLMSRLVSSSRYAGDSTVVENPYTEKDITYFADSRIKAMRRYGASSSSVQNLSFVTDSNTYDDYRNVTNDATSGTVMDWDIINLPRKMTTSDGIVSEYTYLADGTKVSMKAGTTTLHYLGSMVFSQAGSAAPVFESMAFSEGRIVVNSSGAKEVHYHITDHLGSVRSVVKADGTVIAENDYYPYGKRINTTSSTTPTQKDRHTFSGKEDQSLTPGQAPYLDFGARMYSAETGRWMSVDPMADKYYGIGIHVYCAGNPIIRVDNNGKAWKPTYNNGIIEGYRWIPESYSYDSDGSLKNGLYKQAIYFYDNLTFDTQSRYNMGSSLAIVYLPDGQKMPFNACTYPSSSNYATVPEGQYDAMVGMHNGSKSSYLAIKMYDVGKNLNNNTIQLSGPNPAHPNRNYIEGADIHKPGKNNLTGMTNDGKAISEACFLVELDDWDTFINLFLENVTISIGVERR